MDAQQTLVGQSIYLELNNSLTSDTAQILLVPMGVLNGNVVPPTMLRRTLTKWSPRAQWQIDRIAITPVETTPAGTTSTIVEMTDDNALKLSLEVLRPIRGQIDYLIGKGWTLRNGKILSMEVSLADLEDVSKWNSPQGLLRRLLRTRKEAGFPEELFTK